ncbi:AAA family ATPase [Streptomyces sp. NPDC006173]|uniref:AAA family ATPase n=1 Tax=Streptomyces sp. NPDC006173 TaxID=3155349 RepID=UPI0033D58A1C
MSQFEPGALQSRDNEILSIDGALKSAASGIGRFLVASGGAGSGKTSLLSLAAARAGTQDFTVLQARGSFAEHDRPFSLAIRLIESGLTSLSDSSHASERFLFLRKAWTDSTAGELQIRPGLELLRRAFEVLTTSLGPLLLTVDNVHWADAESLQWLSTLPDRIDHLPVAAVVSVCNGVAGTDPFFLDELMFTSTEHIRLANLGYSATAAMLEQRMRTMPDASFIAACMQATEGNPLLLATVADNFFRRRVRPDSVAAVEVSELVIDSLALATQVRLRRISGHALAVFQAISVLEGHATLERVSDLTEIPPALVVDDCRAMVRMGLLAATKNGFRVAQPLLRNAILHESRFESLQKIHAQAAATLDADGVPPEVVATHLLVCPPIGQAWAVETLRKAARFALSGGDPETAALYSRRALRESISDDVRADICLDIVVAGIRTDIAMAARSLTQAAALLPSAVLRARIDPGVTTLLILAGREEVECLVEPAGEAAAKADAHTIRSSLFGTPLNSVSGLVKMLHDLPGSESESSFMLGLTAISEVLSNGLRSVARDLANQATKISPRTNEDLAGHVLAAQALTFCGDLERAAHLCEESVSIAERWQDIPVLALALTGRAFIKNRLGYPSEAVPHAREALSVLQKSGVAHHSGLTQISVLALIDFLTSTGKLREATSLLETNALVGDMTDGLQSANILLARGRLSASCGYMREAIDDLESCGRIFTGLGIFNPAVAPWRSLLSLAYAKEGMIEPARQYASEEVRLARAWGSRDALGAALRTLAAVAEESERLELIEESLACLRGNVSGILLAQTLIDYGNLLAEGNGELSEARKVLREAVEVAEQSSASNLARIALDALASSGGRMSRKKKNGIESLSRSERKVALLAAAGRTNRDIAKALFVQQRTVEVHLTNSYRKLGIQGRDQLANAMAVENPAVSPGKP